MAEVKNIYLPFTDWSVRAIAEGRKTQTRRPMKPQPVLGKPWKDWIIDPNEMDLPTSYSGAIPGDILGVREALVRGGDCAFYRTDGQPVNDDLDSDVGLWKWKRDVLPSIFMPHAYCRYKFPLVRVRAEKLGDITWPDCLAEGLEFPFEITNPNIFNIEKFAIWDAWETKWEEIYGTHDPDLWVWCYDWGER